MKFASRKINRSKIPTLHNMPNSEPVFMPNNNPAYTKVFELGKNKATALVYVTQPLGPFEKSILRH